METTSNDSGERDFKLKCLRTMIRIHPILPRIHPVIVVAPPYTLYNPTLFYTALVGLQSIIQRYIGLQKMGTRNPALIQGQQICVANCYWLKVAKIWDSSKP